MDRIQFLLCKLSEEASEVAQIALKNQQFGLNQVWPEQSYSNKERAHQELNDLLAIVDMLNEESDFNYTPDKMEIEAKKVKVNKYYDKSITLGQIGD